MNGSFAERDVQLIRYSVHLRPPVVDALNNLESSGLFSERAPHSTPCTEWRGLIGCLKLQVIFRKRATNYENDLYR